MREQNYGLISYEYIFNFNNILKLPGNLYILIFNFSIYIKGGLRYLFGVIFLSKWKNLSPPAQAIDRTLFKIYEKVKILMKNLPDHYTICRFLILIFCIGRCFYLFSCPLGSITQPPYVRKLWKNNQEKTKKNSRRLQDLNLRTVR